MNHRLHSINSVSCGPTAVCGISGRNSEDVYKAILQAASEDNEHPSHLNNSAFKHQCRALELFGFDLYEMDGSTRVSASQLEMNPKSAGIAQTVADFVQNNSIEDVVIVYALSPTKETHTFAADGIWFFDCNVTNVTNVNGIHPEIAMLNVVKVYRCRPRGAKGEP